MWDEVVEKCFRSVNKRRAAVLRVVETECLVEVGCGLKMSWFTTGYTPL